MFTKKIVFLTVLFCLAISLVSPSFAIVGTPAAPSKTKSVTAPKKAKTKKMGFFKKLKLIKKIKKEMKAAKKAAKKAAAASIVNDKTFILGAILLAVGIVIPILSNGLLALLAGIVGVIGLILVVWAILKYYS